MRIITEKVASVWGASQRRLLLIAAAALFMLPLVFSASVGASSHGGGVDIKGNLCAGGNLGAPPTSTTVGSEECEDGGGRLQNLIRTALQILFWVAGVAAVFALVIAAIRYILSGGSSSGVTGAKNMIIYALIGLVIAATAQIIVQFILKSTTDSTTSPVETTQAQVVSASDASDV